MNFISIFDIFFREIEEKIKKIECDFGLNKDFVVKIQEKNYLSNLLINLFNATS